MKTLNTELEETANFNKQKNRPKVLFLERGDTIFKVALQGHDFHFIVSESFFL